MPSGTKRARRLTEGLPSRARPLPHHPEASFAEDPGAGASFGISTATSPEDRAHWQAVYTQLLKTNLALFAKEILGLEIGPHIEEWSDKVNKHSRLAVNAARDHSKSTFFSYAYPIWRCWSEPGCEVYLFSRTLDQAMEFLDIIVYGRNNLKGMVDIPKLAHLVPDPDDFRRDPRVRLNRQDVVLTNGSRIRAIGYGKAIRGRHPKYVVCDDVLNDEDMYSETVRTKNIGYFQSAIINMIAPTTQYEDHFEGGQGIVVGTPYHMADLYAWLLDNEVWQFNRYPGIFKDDKGEERALFPWRWSLDQLRGKKAEIGAVAFSREILCLPITDDISIFPSYLFPPLFDKVLTLRPTLAEIEARKLQVFMGVDIARSASVGADYFILFVQGKDPDGHRYLIDIVRSKGLPFRDQLALIATTANRYQPDLVYIESNSMQQIYTDEMRRMTDVPVKEFVTTAVNKYPLDKGVPGLRIVLENQKLTIPRGDEYSRTMTDIWMTEASQFGYVEGKLQGIGVHDDTVMAWWFCEEATKAGGFSFAFGDEDGESSTAFLPGEDDEDYEDILFGDGAGPRLIGY